MKYWDSSALVALVVHESHSQAVRHLVEQDRDFITWWATPVECYSALSRLQRSNLLKEHEISSVRMRLELLSNEMDLVAPTKKLRERALRLLSLHPLSAADALQLAAALRWSHEETAGVGFVSLDDRLRAAASAEGFMVLP